MFPGRISDREILSKCDFLSLVERGGKYLADKEFDVHDLIALKGATLYISPKRQSVKDHQFTKEECYQTMVIANLRIHVERVICRIKGWHIFDQAIPLSMHGCINQLYMDCMLLVSKLPKSSHFNMNIEILITLSGVASPTIYSRYAKSQVIIIIHFFTN